MAESDEVEATLKVYDGTSLELKIAVCSDAPAAVTP